MMENNINDLQDLLKLLGLKELELSRLRVAFMQLQMRLKSYEEETKKAPKGD